MFTPQKQNKSFQSQFLVLGLTAASSQFIIFSLFFVLGLTSTSSQFFFFFTDFILTHNRDIKLIFFTVHIRELEAKEQFEERQ